MRFNLDVSDVLILTGLLLLCLYIYLLLGWIHMVGSGGGVLLLFGLMAARSKRKGEAEA
jgi:hypothetical protein